MPSRILDIVGGREAFLLPHKGFMDSQEFLDIDKPRNRARAIEDERALEIMRDILVDAPVGTLEAFPKERRDATLGMMRSRGISVRQLVRLTEIVREVINAPRHTAANALPICHITR